MWHDNSCWLRPHHKLVHRFFPRNRSNIFFFFSVFQENVQGPHEPIAPAWHYTSSPADLIPPGPEPSKPIVEIFNYQLRKNLLVLHLAQQWGDRFNPFRAPNPFPILIPHDLSPKTGFQFYQALRGPRDRSFNTAIISVSLASDWLSYFDV